MPPKVCIYTAIYGGYDVLKPQPKYEGVSYLCFTDVLPKADYNWNISLVQPSRLNEHPRYLAKRFKCCPHHWVSRAFDFTIWIDGSIVLKNLDFVSRAVEALTSSPFGLIPHPVNNCIYDEARGSLNIPKYSNQPIREQIEHYQSLGYPIKNGLGAGGVIVRRGNDPCAEKIGEEWLYENLIWSYQDQISLPFVLWRNGQWYDALPFELWAHKDFTFSNHVIDDSTPQEN